MFDRFRFRVWNKKNKEMIYNAEIAYDGMNYNTSWQIGKNTNDGWVDCFGYYLDYPEDYEVMQSTGLKDKNGKLIYEGDIVNQIYEDETIYKCEVVYNNCSFQLKHIEDKNKNYINTPMYCYAINYLGHYTEKRLEVIGNIYENKSLLESEV